MATVATSLGPQMFLDYIYLLIQNHLLYCYVLAPVLNNGGTRLMNTVPGLKLLEF